MPGNPSLEDHLGTSGDPIDGGAAIVRAAINLRIVDDGLLIVEHEFHIQIGIAVETDAIGGLFAATVSCGAAGEDAGKVLLPRPLRPTMAAVCPLPHRTWRRLKFQR